MTDMAVTKVELGGFTGSPGLNTFHWCAPAHAGISQENINDFHDQLATSYAAIAQLFAFGVTWTILPDVDILEAETGTLIGAGTYDGEETQTGTGTGDDNLSRASQVGFQWVTADIVDGRRVRGRTFMGPCSGDVFEGDGSIIAAGQAAWPEDFSGIYDNIGSRLVVWHRPKIAAAGSVADVTACTISSRPFVLRSRRD